MAKLVTPYGVRNKKVYNWYYFPHSFSPEIIEFLLNRYNKMAPKNRLLDPFSGSGTAILKAVELGLDAVGIDIMPFAVSIGRAKTQIYNEGDSDKIRAKYIEIKRKALSSKNTTTDLSFISKVFDQDVVRFLSGLSEFILTSDEHYNFLITWLTRLSSAASGSIKSGGFTRNASSNNKKSNRYSRVPQVRKLEEVIVIGDEILESMLSEINAVQITGKAKFIVGDSRDLKSYAHSGGDFDVVITSPPYPNRQDYTRIFAQELFATYSKENKDHKDLRYRTLRSHLEARDPKYDRDTVIPNDLKNLLSKEIEDLLKCHEGLQEIKKLQIDGYKRKPIDSRIPKMIVGYFEDIFILLESLKSVCNDKAEICIIVANVRHSGKVIECDSIIEQLGAMAGYVHVETLIARTKGNSSQQMKYLQREPLRESIVVLRR